MGSASILQNYKKVKERQEMHTLPTFFPRAYVLFSLQIRLLHVYSAYSIYTVLVGVNEFSMVNSTTRAWTYKAVALRMNDHLDWDTK